MAYQLACRSSCSRHHNMKICARLVAMHQSALTSRSVGIGRGARHYQYAPSWPSSSESASNMRLDIIFTTFMTSMKWYNSAQMALNWHLFISCEIDREAFTSGGIMACLNAGAITLEADNAHSRYMTMRHRRSRRLSRSGFCHDAYGSSPHRLWLLFGILLGIHQYIFHEI